MLDLFPDPRRKLRAKVVAKLNVEVVVAFIWYPFYGNLVLAILLQCFDCGLEGFRHLCDDTVLVPASSGQYSRVYESERRDLRSVEDDGKHDASLLSRVGHASMPQPQIAEDNRTPLQAGVDRSPDFAPFLQVLLSNHGLAHFAVVVKVCILGTQPELSGTIFGATVNETGVVSNGKGVLGVLKAEVSMNHLALIRGDEGVAADEVNLRLGSQNV